jgi:hypothetical protein
MGARWNGGRPRQRSYLSELLDIVNGTGRRISAICQLRYDDLRLDQKPHGAIRWPAETDKQGCETEVPIGPEVRWATERKNLPTVDVAAAGGWAGTETLVRCYQQADDATMLAVVLGGGQLKGKQA